MNTPSNKPNKTLAFVSLLLGVICFILFLMNPTLWLNSIAGMLIIPSFALAGILLSIIALVLAYKKPERFGGRGIAFLALAINGLTAVLGWGILFLTKWLAEIFWGR